MTDDDRLENALRDALRARDPGPAPADLRRRIAAVPLGRAATGWRTLLRPARNFATLGLTAAALVLGLLLVAVVRPAPSGPGGPGATPSPSQPGLTPPIGRSVIALDPVTLAGLLGAIILIAWIWAEAIATSRLRRTGDVPGLPLGLRWLEKPWLRRLVFAGLLVALIGLFPLHGGSRTLSTGSYFSAGQAHYLGWIPGHAGQRDVALYRYPPGGSVSFVESIRNASSLPLTILGGDPSKPWMELRLFPEHGPETPIIVGETPTYPLVPVELLPGAERELAIVIHFARCPEFPQSSFEPTPDPSGNAVGPLTNGEESLDSVTVQYSQAGLRLSSDVPLSSIVAVTPATDGMCGFDFDYGSASPR